MTESSHEDESLDSSDEERMYNLRETKHEHMFESSTLIGLSFLTDAVLILCVVIGVSLLADYAKIVTLTIIAILAFLQGLIINRTFTSICAKELTLAIGQLDNSISMSETDPHSLEVITLQETWWKRSLSILFSSTAVIGVCSYFAISLVLGTNSTLWLLITPIIIMTLGLFVHVIHHPPVDLIQVGYLPEIANNLKEFQPMALIRYGKIRRVLGDLSFLVAVNLLWSAYLLQPTGTIELSMLMISVAYAAIGCYHAWKSP